MATPTAAPATSTPSAAGAVYGAFLAAEPTTAPTGATTARPRRRGVTVLTHVLAWGSTLFVLYLGLSFLIAPQWAVPGFGLPEWPQGAADAFLNVKGDRDLAFGAVLLMLLLTRQFRAFGWVLLATSVAPFGDMAIVLARGGSPVAAFAIHFATAVSIAALGAFIAWRERPAKTAATAGR